MIDSMIEFAALLACGIFVALSAFQAALIFKAPLGQFAWGGQHRVLPAKFRVGSAVSLVLYALFSVLILDGAGVINVVADNGFKSAAMWVVTAYFGLGILMNGISKSKYERLIMTPVALMLTILFLMVSLN